MPEEIWDDPHRIEWLEKSPPHPLRRFLIPLSICLFAIYLILIAVDRPRSIFGVVIVVQRPAVIVSITFTVLYFVYIYYQLIGSKKRYAKAMEEVLLDQRNAIARYQRQPCTILDLFADAKFNNENILFREGTKTFWRYGMWDIRNHRKSICARILVGDEVNFDLLLRQWRDPRDEMRNLWERLKREAFMKAGKQLDRKIAAGLAEELKKAEYLPDGTVKCITCKGNGKLHKTRIIGWETCSLCGGKGFVSKISGGFSRTYMGIDPETGRSIFVGGQTTKSENCICTAGKVERFEIETAQCKSCQGSGRQSVSDFTESTRANIIGNYHTQLDLTMNAEKIHSDLVAQAVGRQRKHLQQNTINQ